MHLIYGLNIFNGFCGPAQLQCSAVGLCKPKVWRWDSPHVCWIVGGMLRLCWGENRTRKNSVGIAEKSALIFTLKTISKDRHAVLPKKTKKLTDGTVQRFPVCLSRPSFRATLKLPHVGLVIFPDEPEPFEETQARDLSRGSAWRWAKGPRCFSAAL